MEVACHESEQSVAEMEGVDGMEIGTSPVLRGAAWQSSSSLACPLSPCYLSFCHSLPFSLFHSTSPLPLTWLSVSSLELCLATSVLILSVSAELQLQLLTAHHLGLDHHPLIWLHCVEGLPGLTPLQMISLKQKRTDLYLYYSSYRDWREGLW